MKLGILAWIAAAMIVMVMATMICIDALRKPGPILVSVEDERAIADALLAEKLSGPRYFNAPSNGLYEEGGPWINVGDARSQLPRIVDERKLGTVDTRAVEQLIERLAEPHPSRVVGGMRINLLRLNLSLDSIK